jgi:hypothetical protein
MSISGHMKLLEMKLYGRTVLQPAQRHKNLYQLEVRFAREDTEQETGFTLDDQVKYVYQNFDKLESVRRLIAFLKRNLVAPDDYPHLFFRIAAEHVPLEDYQPTPLGRPREIKETKYVNGMMENDSIYELSNGMFVQNIRFCDIIKGWDYDPFFST